MTAPALAPFWSDDFDMDLLRVVPDAAELLGDVVGVTLFTQGHTTHGRLNHPAVWNTNIGLAAFFGLSDPARPAAYACDHQIVECTFFEAVRDCWPHGYVLLVERRAVADGQRWRPYFDTLMYHRRGWRTTPAQEVRNAERHVRSLLRAAADRLRTIMGGRN